MKNIIKYSILGFSFLLFLAEPKAQVSTKAVGDSTILRAMADELLRNQKALLLEGYARPCFISYSLKEVNIYSVSGTLGALVRNKSDLHRDVNTRMLVGSYALNDENFVDRAKGQRNDDGSLPVPLDNDYWGLRRSFWLMTNNVYKNAAETYRNKLTALKQKNLTEKDLVAPDFSTEVPVKYYDATDEVMPNRDKNVQLVKDVSAIFREFPEVVSSSVSVNAVSARNFFVNSETTETVYPAAVSYFIVQAMVLTPENDNESDVLVYVMPTDGRYPSADTLKQQAKLLAENLINRVKQPVFQDSYDGPLLMVDQAVAHAGFRRLLTYGDGLMAVRRSLINDPQKGVYYNTDQTWENRIGRKVLDSKLSVLSMPKMSVFQGVPLVGSYKIDEEGVVPADTLVLVKDGLLKTQMVDRTPIAAIQKSNGHGRIYFDGNTFYSAGAGPGVIMVKSNVTLSLEKLKERARQLAKDEGYDYYITIKPLIAGNLYSPMNYFKVDIKTGAETLLKGISDNKINTRSLKEIEGVGSGLTVLNTFIGDGNQSRSITRGFPTSIIAPSAILLKAVEISGSLPPMMKTGPLLPNPVGLRE